MKLIQHPGIVHAKEWAPQLKGKDLKQGIRNVLQFINDSDFAERCFPLADNPKIAVSVIVEHGCSGSSAAVPVAARVLEKFMEKYHPDERAEIIEWEKKLLSNFYSKKTEEKKLKESLEPNSIETE